MTCVTRGDFTDAYRRALCARYEWARASRERLDRFMGSVEQTLDGGSTWNHRGEAVDAAWAAVGGRGSPSLRALRGLEKIICPAPTFFQGPT